MTPEASFPSGLLADIQRDWMLQEYDRALARIEQHWLADPRDPMLQLHYATILGHCSRFHTARTVLDELVAAAGPGQRLWALGSAGVACGDFQRFDWAAEYLQKAAAEPEPPAIAFHRWVEALERLNRLQEASTALAEGQLRFPGHPGLKLLSARLARRSGAVEQAERLARGVICMQDASPEIRCQAGYELGHALDAQDRCAEAYAAFLAAKEIQRPQAAAYASIWHARMQRLRSAEDDPSAEDFRRWADTSPTTPRRHAFLVGCPRSGTTLLERMLGSHPQLAASSESTVWLSSLWMPFLRECDADGISGMRAVLGAMTPQQIEAGRSRYWRDVGQTVDRVLGDRLVLDKNPSIFSVLPGAVRFFPDSRMLVALRDPRDVVWSCFTQYLPINPTTAAFVRLDTTAEQTTAELGQWVRLRPRLATPWLEVRYENLVQQTEPELRRVLSFLGLPWSPDVLAFHERGDMVRSPTYAAAAQPVHGNALGRWQRYAALFEPLEAQLGQVVPEHRTRCWHGTRFAAPSGPTRRQVARGKRVALRQARSPLALSVGCGLLFGMSIIPARATDYYWDVSGATAGAGGATPSGTWSATDTTLSTDSTGATAVAPHTTTTADRLFFSAGTDATGTYTVTVNGTQNIGRLTFEEGTVNLTGGTINFGAVSGLIDGDSTPDTISSVISGTAGVRFSGGTQTLTGTNTYTGTTQVGGSGLSAATLILAAPGGNAVSGNVLSLGGGKYTSGGTVTLGAPNQINDTATVTLNSGHYSGSSVFSLNGFDETIGGITLTHFGNASSVTFRNGAATNATVTLAGSGTYTTASGDRGSGRNVVDGSTGKLNLVVSLTGTGSQTFAGTDARYTGTTTVNSGTLRLWNTSAWASAITLNGGTLELQQQSASTGTFAGAATRTHSQTIGGTGGTLLKTGDGTVILTGANTYQGATQINLGTLRAGSATAFGTNSAVTLADAAGAMMDLNNFNISIGSLAGGGTTGGNVSLGAGILTTGANNTSTSYGGVVSGTGALVKAGTGTQTLTGTNTYTGGTTISSGTLQLGNGGASGSIVGNVVDNGALVFNRNNALSFGEVISGSGTVTQAGAGTTTLTGTNSYAGGTSFSAGILQVAADANLGAAPGDLTFNGGTLKTTATFTTSRNATLNAGGGTILVDAGTTLTEGGGITGAGTLTKAGGGTLLVTNDNNYTGGTTISAGMLQIGNGGTTGSIDGAVVNNGVLTFDRADTDTFSGAISGIGVLNQVGLGTIILAADNSYLGGTTISAGTLQLGNGGASGSIVGSVVNNGTLAFDRSDSYQFDGLISGAGALQQLGSGTTVLTGNNTYTGATDVLAGTLLVNGNQSGATGLTSVAGGATLGGSGAIGGGVTVADGGTLSPGGSSGAAGTLTIAGALTLSNSSALNYNFGQAGTPGGQFNDLITVGGNLVLDGTLNITQTPGGSFGPGVYRVMNYNGTLTNNGLDVTDPNYFVQTSVANQVNLVNSAGLALSFWDGNAGPHSNSAVNGGSGTWRAAGDQNWTDSTGLFAAPFANGSFAIFQGAAGTVTVDSTNGPVQAAGMQFATDGYLVQGADIGLVGPQSIIRVGDGAAAGAAYVATIASNLTGSSQLVKTDLGTLVLKGANSYSGGTAINGGTLQVASDGSLGAASGGLSLDGGTLHTTDTFTSARAVSIAAGGGTFDTNALTRLTLTGTVGGAGTLTKTDAGTLVLTGTNSYQGGTVINGGTVEVSADANLGNAAGALTFNGGTLHTTGTFTAARDATLNAGGGTFDTDNSTTLTLTGAVGGAGALTKGGAGTLVLTADNTYAGGTTISGGTLQLGDGGATGAITGDVVDNGKLVFDRNNSYGFAGLISGSGGLDQIGSGVTILTADNSYAGATNVGAGTLIIDGDQSAASGATTVAAGGALGGIGTIGGAVSVLDGGALNPGDIGTTPGTLTINGNLNLAANATLNYNFGQAGVVGGAYNDLTVVHGGLTLDGAVNVAQTSGGDFGPGIYRIISYDGTLTDLGLVSNSLDHFVQTSVANQVNLVNTTGVTLNYWDGDAGPKGNDQVNGGNGTWRAAGDDNWTNDTGHINAPFSTGSFAIFAGQAGTVDVDSATNGQVQAAGMQFATDGYLVQGESIALVGSQSIIRVGDGTSPGAGFAATIASALTGNSQLVKTDAGTLVLAGTNSYTGGTAVNGGTLRVSSDNNLGAAEGGLSFNGGTLDTTASFASGRAIDVLGQGTIETDAATTLTLNGALSGAGALTKSGAGTLALTADSSAFAGTTAIGGGTLNVSGSLCGAVNVLSGGRLEGTGTVCDTTNAAGGIVAAGNPGVPGTLTLAGNYTGNGGTLEIETVLSGDASATDRLVVTGTTAGTTTLKVANVGGGGAQTVEGIKIIDVGGTSAGTFSLAGDYVFEGDQAVVGGAYAYRLYKNGVSTPDDGDWYLRSALINNSPQPLYSPAVPLYEAYPGVLQSLNELSTLQQRGNRSWAGASQGADEIGSVPAQSAIWARIEAAHTRQSPESATTVSDYEVTAWKLQSGIDGLIYEDATGILLGGVTFHYGTASSDISSIYGVGSIRATGYGFGGTLTWYGDNGFYTDGQAEVTWYDSDLKSATLGTDLAKGNSGFGYALSVEAGQKIALQGKWTLTPQAQLAYSSVRFDSFTDPFDAAVSLSRSDVLIGRAGLSLDYEDAWTGAQGKVSRSHLYGIANLYYDVLDGNDVDVSGTAFHEHDQPMWGGVGLGGTLSWADDRYTVFGEAFAKSSLKNFGDSRAIGAKLGFSVKW
ncbi:autotransporter outer membrane beta-barrel domain-containing protein [Mesorhizobium sp. VK4C]|uniref:autotransporter outer membrane beta-barrel domain-containing protein n=1 Tax=Mesorhizobium captivum TaxID=3072319 RepID=UPI002A248A37|nr:autotransporter outer membrane beta-barrel domain-containing protein [Mesorhizobium sp. VK4C]MDX8497990.1 autotransporter outer membrane beta-barrel domain-containing protein [Mesorhizobium sp. VK4C]